MGILKLMDFLKNKFPRCIREIQPTDLRGKTVAIDASNVIYQFLIQTQVIKNSDSLNMPIDMHGNKTGHLVGLMARVTLCQQNKIKPVWVFDGKPPQQKYKELSRRSKLKKEAGEKMEEAMMEGDLMQALKHQKRTMKITQIEKEYAIKMLNLMGLPTIEAPTESEAQCAYLSKMGLVDGVVTEDMDCLPLGSRIMFKTFTKTKPVQEIHLQTILEDSKLSLDQFIDFCIMCGCDYTGRITNIGPVRAYDLIKKHRSLENIMEHLKISDNGRYRVQSQFEFESARKLFKQPVVTEIREPFEWKRPDESNLKQFLSQLDFNPNRIKNWLQKADKLLG